ncbi:hypothetical protein QYE76_023833 [Lolium multiflorum]|uniref:Transposase (putative) gypsy type domain-containing protein n=1 Tax=Lolium multiflorum TaxID=4521 RepID=A0AAD8RCJ8_LOLMU|nr:hypothetical protein QYE76_023833 [Lolium multiflorum]
MKLNQPPTPTCLLFRPDSPSHPLFPETPLGQHTTGKLLLPTPNLPPIRTKILPDLGVGSANEWGCSKNLEAKGFLRPDPGEQFRVLGSSPEGGEMGVTKALVERGFSFPPSDFFSEILKVYGLQPHNISPNSVLAISNHITLCEGHLRVPPELPLFQYYFSVKKEKIQT